MTSNFKVGDLFIGRSIDINLKRGIIGGIRGSGRQVEVLCRFEEGYDEWRFPRDLWKGDNQAHYESDEGSFGELSPNSSSGEGSNDSEESSGSENLSEDESSDSEDEGIYTILTACMIIRC
jgi:hypothetical protein